MKIDTAKNSVQWGLQVRYPLQGPHALGKALSYSQGKQKWKRRVKGTEKCREEKV